MDDTTTATTPPGRRWSLPAVAGVAVAVLVTAALLVALSADEPWTLDVPWASAWDIRLHLSLDGLGLLYGLLAAAVAIPVLIYASAYVPLHLAHTGAPRGREALFVGWMVLFLLTMVALAAAQDLWLVFVLWDLTAIASYVLIGFDREERTARTSALMALLVTGISAVLLLLAVLMLRADYGTSSIPELVERVRTQPIDPLAGALLLSGALTKSAQVPLHFWLRRAMAAPTPVSAYLHSAAMVAAGVLLVSRVHPLLASQGVLLDACLAVGLLSMAIGGAMALAGDELKPLLAWSTVSQYGYVTAMLGVGGAEGLGAACFYVLAHGLAKSGLFLAAGAVTEATGTARLDELGGLRRRMPGLAIAVGVLCASLGALPLTLGFFKDELLFKAAADRGGWLAALAVLSAGLTLAYMWRLWASTFLGPERTAPQAIPARLTAPVGVLAALSVLGGIVVGPVAGLAPRGATTPAPAPVELHPAYHLDTRIENLLALCAWATALVLIRGRVVVAPVAAWVRRVGDRVGPEALYHGGLHGIVVASTRLHDIEVRDLRGRIVAVLVPTLVLVATGIALTLTRGETTYVVGSIEGSDAALVVALVVVVLGAVVTTRMRRHVSMALAASTVGFAMALVYQLLAAPDVSLVAVVVETIFALLFLAVFALVPSAQLKREARVPQSRSRRTRDRVVAVLAGLTATAVVWGALSRRAAPPGMAERHIELVKEAHGSDVVTVILADFRGFDTLVEATVVVVAMLAVATLLRRGRSW